jgi:cell division protein FtsB
MRANNLNGFRALVSKIRFKPSTPRVLLGPVKEKVDLGIWSRLTQMVVILVAVAILILIGLTYLPLIHQNERMRREILRLDTQLQQQETISKKLRADIDDLRNDPATVARLVREKLGYAKPDETVIHFETNSPNITPR